MLKAMISFLKEKTGLIVIFCYIDLD